jgi:hypothetical protein
VEIPVHEEPVEAGIEPHKDGRAGVTLGHDPVAEVLHDRAWQLALCGKFSKVETSHFESGGNEAIRNGAKLGI